jgi:Baseplate J-like protein
MTTLTTKNFTGLVQEWAAVVQSSIATVRPTLVLSFTKGAILRAMAEAQASVSLWLQGNILKLLTATRLATSVGVDVDTWCADYMPGAVNGAVLPNGAISPRLPANAATGLVTFARATPTNPATVPVGALVQSSDGVQTFAVTVDATNSAYSAILNGYVIPAAVTSIQVPVQFQFPAGYIPSAYTGPVGNVQVGGISILQTGISGVDTVTNAAALTNGFNSESDAALKARFPLYIASLAKGTEGAIGYAISSVQQGMQYQIWEPGIGGFTILTVYVDDGSGAIPSPTLTAAQAAAFAIRAAGVQMAIFAATVLSANVTMTIATAPGYYHPTVVAQVVAAITSYINGLGLGATPTLGTLSYMRLAQVAFDASPAVIDVTGYSLNSAQADLVPAAGQTIKSGTIIVS